MALVFIPFRSFRVFSTANLFGCLAPRRDSLWVGDRGHTFLGLGNAAYYAYLCVRYFAHNRFFRVALEKILNAVEKTL